MDRASFLMAAAATIVAPTPMPPAPRAVPKSWTTCDKTTSLPYDRPIDMSMEVLDGPDFHLMNYRGQAVMMNIFTTWCSDCNIEQPYFVEFAGKYAAAGLRVIGIDFFEPDSKVRSYRKRYGISYPIAMDRDGRFVKALEHGTGRGTLVFPTTIFISPSGYLYCYKTGDMSKDELEYRIRTFLAEAPPTVARPPATPAQASTSRP